MNVKKILIGSSKIVILVSVIAVIFVSGLLIQEKLQSNKQNREDEYAFRQSAATVKKELALLKYEVDDVAKDVRYPAGCSFGSDFDIVPSLALKAVTIEHNKLTDLSDRLLSSGWSAYEPRESLVKDTGVGNLKATYYLSIYKKADLTAKIFEFPEGYSAMKFTEIDPGLNGMFSGVDPLYSVLLVEQQYQVKSVEHNFFWFCF